MIDEDDWFIAIGVGALLISHFVGGIDNLFWMAIDACQAFGVCMT